MLDVDLSTLHRHNSAIANLGRYAVSGVGFTALLDEACAMLLHALQVDLVAVVEEQSHAFVLRATRGFPRRLIDRPIAPLGTSLAGFTLDGGEPVVVVDLADEARFEPAEQLGSAGVTSGVSVPIRGASNPFGVLSAFSRTRREFSEAEVVLVRLVANTLAAAAATERARTAMRERDNLLTELVEHGPDILIRFDRELRHLYVSPAVERSTGLAAEHFIGRTNEELGMPAELCALWRCELEAVFRTGEPRRYEFSFDGPEGERLFESHAVPERGHDGSRETIVVYTRDRTDARRAELEHLASRERAAESERRFRGAFDDAATGMILVDADGTILRVNAELGRMLDYSPDELAGTKIFEFMPAEDTEASRESIAAIVNGERDSFRVEKSYVRRDGSLLATHVAVSGIRTAAGELEYFVVQVQDLSELRRVQSELGETEEQLRQSQKMEAIGKLAGGVAHDFNNLLTAINGYSDIALSTLQDDGAASTRRYIQEIRRAGERAAELTQQLLSFSRRQVLEPEVIDINDVVQDYLSMLERLVGDDVQIVARLGDALPMVNADPGQLGQVLLNLVVNARDAMPDGGRLTIETQTERVGNGLRVVLRVGDTGIGMDRETVRHIFEPFFTTKEQGKGTGLGLSTVHGIVKQSGGVIEVDSAPGEGSTFAVFLHTTTCVARSPHPPAEPVPGAGESVLVVEDEPVVRGLVHEMLTSAGYTVLVAATPGEAIAIAEGDDLIDAVVTDLVMPEMNGHQLAQRLHELRAGVPVLYTSGYAGDIVEARGLVEAGDAFIRKPFSAAILVGKLQQLLAERVPCS
jgi:two-component system cell cycle sensor histidine kinase/response regulator CckA